MKEQSANYRSAEESRLTQPAWLYRIKSGASVYFYTSYDKSITVADGPALLMSDPQEFVSIPIEHQPPKESADRTTDPTIVAVAANDTLLRKYFVTAPTAEITIEIWRINSANLPGPIDYGDVFLDFKGICQSVSFAGYQIEAAFITPVQQEDKIVPAFFFQKTCNHVLGSTFCGVNKENFKLVTTIASVDRVHKTVTVANTTMNIDSPTRAITISEETFQGGQLVDSQGNRIGVIACDIIAGGTRLWLNYWPGTLVNGGAITVYLGCLKIMRVCETTFENKANFGGMPYIPITNPATNSIVT